MRERKEREKEGEKGRKEGGRREKRRKKPMRKGRRDEGRGTISLNQVHCPRRLHAKQNPKAICSVYSLKEHKGDPG